MGGEGLARRTESAYRATRRPGLRIRRSDHREPELQWNPRKPRRAHRTDHTSGTSLCERSIRRARRRATHRRLYLRLRRPNADGERLWDVADVSRPARVRAVVVKVVAKSAQGFFLLRLANCS